ncbi:hypothetical protein PR048_030729 [Dryococelus australis]|uniref:Uncharacterized protein n=1 Tax=Dryococelus australis TaxID=614101 RepID=A0ABQ9GDK5_9NEOP|nr:hypothetical protein PR048_030729 [Dryococelus australis]
MWGKREIPEKTGQPSATSGMTCNIVHHNSNICLNLVQYVWPTHQAMALLAVSSEPMRVTGGEYGAAGENGRSLRKPVDERHCPARFTDEKILERSRRESNSCSSWWEASSLTTKPPRPQYIRQRSKYRNRIRFERASQNKSNDNHKTPYDRVKRCLERKINIKASERVNVDSSLCEKQVALPAGSCQLAQCAAYVARVTARLYDQSSPVQDPRRAGERKWASAALVGVRPWRGSLPGVKGNPRPTSVTGLLLVTSPLYHPALLVNFCHLRKVKGPAYLHRFSPCLAEERGSYKGHTGTLYKSAIAATRRALNWPYIVAYVRDELYFSVPRNATLGLQCHDEALPDRPTRLFTPTISAAGCHGSDFVGVTVLLIVLYEMLVGVGAVFVGLSGYCKSSITVFEALPSVKRWLVPLCDVRPYKPRRVQFVTFVRPAGAEERKRGREERDANVKNIDISCNNSLQSDGWESDCVPVFLSSRGPEEADDHGSVRGSSPGHLQSVTGLRTAPSLTTSQKGSCDERPLKQVCPKAAFCNIWARMTHIDEWSYFNGPNENVARCQTFREPFSSVMKMNFYDYVEERGSAEGYPGTHITCLVSIRERIPSALQCGFLSRKRPKVKKRGSDTGDTNTHDWCLDAPTRRACSVSVVTLCCENEICKQWDITRDESPQINLPTPADSQLQLTLSVPCGTRPSNNALFPTLTIPPPLQQHDEEGGCRTADARARATPAAEESGPDRNAENNNEPGTKEGEGCNESTFPRDSVLDEHRTLSPNQPAILLGSFHEQVLKGRTLKVLPAWYKSFNRRKVEPDAFCVTGFSNWAKAEEKFRSQCYVQQHRLVRTQTWHEELGRSLEGLKKKNNPLRRVEGRAGCYPARANIKAGNTANEVFVVETLHQQDVQRWGRAVRRHASSLQPSALCLRRRLRSTKICVRMEASLVSSVLGKQQAYRHCKNFSGKLPKLQWKFFNIYSVCQRNAGSAARHDMTKTTAKTRQKNISDGLFEFTARLLTRSAHERGALSLWCNFQDSISLCLHAEHPGIRTEAGLQQVTQRMHSAALRFARSVGEIWDSRNIEVLGADKRREKGKGRSLRKPADQWHGYHARISGNDSLREANPARLGSEASSLTRTPQGCQDVCFDVMNLTSEIHPYDTDEIIRKTDVLQAKNMQHNHSKRVDIDTASTVLQHLFKVTVVEIGMVRFPARSHYNIFARGNRAERCHWSAGFLGDLPFPPPLYSGVAPYSPRFTIIGSQDLDPSTRNNVSERRAALKRGSLTAHERRSREASAYFSQQGSATAGHTHEHGSMLGREDGEGGGCHGVS